MYLVELMSYFSCKFIAISLTCKYSKVTLAPYESMKDESVCVCVNLCIAIASLVPRRGRPGLAGLIPYITFCLTI